MPRRDSDGSLRGICAEKDICSKQCATKDSHLSHKVKID